MVRRPEQTDEELRAALTELEDSVPGDATPARVKVAGRNLGPVLGGTIVVLAAFLVVSARGWFQEPVGQPTPSPITSAAAPSAAASPSSAPINVPNLSWVTDPFPGGAITAATATKNTWIALGEGEAWLSEDGSLWQQGTIGSVAVPPWVDPGLTRGLPHPISAARLGQSWFAVSRLQGGLDAITPVVFISTDGLTWTHLPSSDWWGLNPTDLASNGTILIATNIGPLGGQGSVFVSENGVTWTEHFAPGGPASMVDIYAGPDTIVAVGFRYTDETLESPVAWVSKDGSTWAEADPIAAARATTPRAVGRTASGTFVMLATVTTFPDGCSETACLIHDVRAWYSADGQNWQPAEFPAASAPFGSYREIELLPIPGGLLAIASTGDGSTAWVTSDGIAWKDAELTSPELSVSAGASSGDSVRLFDASGHVVTGTTP